MEKRNIEATKEAILSAAERLMAAHSDPSEVTSRAVTKEAGVNLAMINYCFGSREAMLFEVFNRLKKRAVAMNPAFLRILSSELTAREKLIELHFESVKMLTKHRNYAKALLRYVLMNREISDDRDSVAFIAEHFAGTKTEGECRFIAYQISSLHELLVLRCDDLEKSCGIDLTNDETLRKIVTENIDRFLV